MAIKKITINNLSLITKIIIIFKLCVLYWFNTFLIFILMSSKKLYNFQVHDLNSFKCFELNQNKLSKTHN